MTRFLLALPLLLATVPAIAQDRPARLAANISYEARGVSPGWQLAIGDRIALRMDPDADGFAIRQYFPRARSRSVEGVRRWESRSAGGAVMTIEARRAPCTLGELTFRDTVTIVQGDRRLAGCGGPRVSGNDG